MKKILTFLILVVPILIASCSSTNETYEITGDVAPIDHAHAAFTGILQTHMQGNKFDYAALKESPGQINAYLDTLASVERSEYDTWTREEQMAFLINLYNAATLKLVIDHYPIESIREIGGMLRSPWKQNVVRMFGEMVTLDHVEHDVLRPDFKDARIHFAVNCASIGCPDLRNEAFRAADLERQLEEQTQAFLSDRTRNHFDVENNTLHLSSIFDWYEEDFIEASGSVEKFVAPYLSDREQAVIAQGNIRIRHTDYDWNLNKP
ncbi:MAG: DUF547 domain-containing protein [Luteolibacter sp.]